jgi:F-type H+-transporting ATPase subunit a
VINPLPLAIDIHPGEHPEWHVAGFTLNADTIWVTVIAGAIVVGMGFVLRHHLTKETEDHIPTKLQLVWETVITEVQNQVESNLGKVRPGVIQLAVGLFFFILVANWLEVIPTEYNDHTGHLLVSPTADTNLTYAMAIISMIGVWSFSFRQRGFKGFFKHYFEPVPWMFPLEILQDLLKPVTLALRLFGNVFAGGIMLALIAGLVSWTPANLPIGGVLAGIFNIVWKGFDTIFLGGLQAFIFALLTVLYFGMADSHDEGHGEHEEPKDAHEPQDEAQPQAA